jgi:hypothetical protein
VADQESLHNKEHNMKNIHEVIKQSEYEFLQTNEWLGKNTMFLVFGGSQAYGTANENSDIDIRGCAFNTTSNLLGSTNFEQVVDNQTDTTIYSFNKLIHLLCSCNPNCIELLGSKSEHYVICNPIANEFIANRKIFLSKRAQHSFGGYAISQLRRLQNAVARDALPQTEKEKHILASMQNAMVSFVDKYKEFGAEEIRLYVGPSEKLDFEAEVLIDISVKGYPIRDLRSVHNDLSTIVGSYDKLNNRNKKKDENHLNKHAMHLLRLYLMCIDIFEKEEIITHREKDLELLLSIRNGKYMNSDGTYHKDFFELIDEYEKRMQYAAANTSLPDSPNMKLVEEFQISVNERRPK